jgi:catechol 2,3-dioxygenase-like lactoylglutathione lyase family enzyme
MSQLASVAIQVNDLETSLHFFVDLLGFPLQERHPDGERALLLDLTGTPLLLAGPNETDVTSYLTESPFVLTLGGPDTVIGFLVQDLDALVLRLHEKGVKQMGPIEDRLVDCLLTVRDPNGYTLNFLSLKDFSPEELTALYAYMMDQLEATLADVSETDWNLSREASSWTIRQIVHHLADCETMFLQTIRTILMEPGRSYHQNWPGSNEVVSTPMFLERPVDSSLAFLRASHEYILHLLQYTPGAWERMILDQGRGGHEMDLREIFTTILAHMQEHLDEIRAIRQRPK